MDGVLGRPESEHEKLNQALDDAANDDFSSNAPVPVTAVAKIKRQDNDAAQWQVRGNGAYYPCGQTIKTIPAGEYWPQHHDTYGPYLERRAVVSDDIVQIPDSASARVLATMHKFWNSKARYAKFGLLFKRGILLWGPPGSGKSVTVRQLSAQVIAMDGLVLYCGHPGLLETLLRSVRSIENDRPIIVIYEDVDEIIRQYNEHALLSLLDGESQIENIVHIATTNYPEQLGARIVNRPSRFDDRVFVGMPTAEQRECYFRHVAPECPDIAQWVKDTEDLSIAHLRELVAAVYCLESPYETTLERLQSMNERPKEVDGFKAKPVGFSTPVAKPRQGGW